MAHECAILAQAAAERLEGLDRPTDDGVRISDVELSIFRLVVRLSA
jgi:hypothetical protein